MTKLFSTIALIVLSTLTITVQAQKKSITIVSKEVIQADKETVFSVLKSLEQYPEWSPFVVTDPEQKNHVTGTNGEIGSVFHWEGVKEKSKGTQTLKDFTENEALLMQCAIEKPFEGYPSFAYQLNETAEGTEVVLTFDMKASGFSNFMMKLFGVKKEVTKTNELGLSRLKAYVEAI